MFIQYGASFYVYFIFYFLHDCAFMFYISLHDCVFVSLFFSLFLVCLVCLNQLDDSSANRISFRTQIFKEGHADP